MRTRAVRARRALRRTVATAALVALAGLVSGTAATAATPSPFFNGFETDTSGWSGDIERVSSGTNGVPSADGAYHAEIGNGGAFTQWGAYTDEFPANGYTTSIDIYFDLDECPANDTRYDWSSAVSTPANTHRRDFVFNIGCFTDDGDYAVLSASNNALGWPKNPTRDPFRIDVEGWYTLEHRFEDNGSGILTVDMSILDAGGNVLHTWTLSDPSDVIGTTVGGNRYGWLLPNSLPFVAVDNSRLHVEIGPPVEESECKKGGWQQFNAPAFKNQGDCVSYVATNGKAEANG